MAQQLARKNPVNQFGKRVHYTQKMRRYLKFSCGFCKERFRSQRKRTDHTNECKEGRQ